MGHLYHGYVSHNQMIYGELFWHHSMDEILRLHQPDRDFTACGPPSRRQKRGQIGRETAAF